jgi:ferredoxin-type protein NapH
MLYESLNTASNAPELSAKQKIYLGVHILGWFLFLIGSFLPVNTLKQPMWISGVLLLIAGAIAYIYNTEMNKSSSMGNHYRWMRAFTNGQALCYIIAVVLTLFYVFLYWSDNIFGYHIFEPLFRVMDPLSYALRGEPTPWWFFYGTVYTFAILITGFRVILKYRHNKYQIIRTVSVMLSQVVLAWLLPNLLVFFKYPERYLNYSWPLSPKDLWPENFMSLIDSPKKLSWFLAFYGLAFIFILTPILTYYFGKRWYCSWVCGCGGLANTMGDQWRQLSDKSERAWKIEKVSIYSVLVLVTVTTVMLWVTWKFGIWNTWSRALYDFYGFAIILVFSGAVGVGFYPIFGTRVWCRFGCPQAAILGVLQRFFSRFRITTNGAQCISCGNCSTYCEMGIDVRAYAQKGENIIRASCVGCGICSNVCPRGVLNLENGPQEGRYNTPLKFIDDLKAK